VETVKSVGGDVTITPRQLGRRSHNANSSPLELYQPCLADIYVQGYTAVQVRGGNP
jgi:hypothetical protein